MNLIKHFKGVLLTLACMLAVPAAQAQTTTSKID
jgi:hypothetical protein